MSLSEDAQREYIKHPSLLETDVMQSRLVYVPERDTFYAFNITATLIWTLLDQHGGFGGGHRAGAFTQLRHWFRDPPRTAKLEADVDGAIQEFIDLGMLVRRPPALATHHTSCPLHDAATKYDYLAPHLTVYDSEWMRSTHPYYFHSLVYSDRWSPSGPA